ncbi:hypothetical protein D3C71_1673430 [compost metagenome]
MCTVQDHAGAGLADQRLGLASISAAAREHQPGGHSAGTARIAQGATDQHRALGAQAFDGDGGLVQQWAFRGDQVQGRKTCVAMRCLTG